MKTALKTVFALGALLILLSCSDDSKNKSITKDSSSESVDRNKGGKALVNCIDLTTEDIIEIGPYIRTNTVAIGERTNFATYFKYINTSNHDKEDLDQNPIKLNMSALLQLYNDVKSIDANIRGLQIYLGLTGNKINFLLRNVVMKCSQTEIIQNNLYTYTPIELSASYICNGDGTISTISIDDFNALTANYAAKIQIKHKTSDSDFTGINYTPLNWKNDTKSVIFSYQEIFYYYHANYNCAAGKNDYDKDLYLYNGSSPKKDGDQKDNDTVNKHTIFMSSYQLDDKSAPKKFKILVVTEVANLAHLCPPSCFPVYKVTNKKTCSNP